MRFLITNFFYAPNLNDEHDWQTVQAKINRDYPWLLSEQYEIYYSGLGRGWKGQTMREHVISHAGLRSTLVNMLNYILAWVIHLYDAIKLMKRDELIVVAPTPESGLGAAIAKIIAPTKIHLCVRVQGHTASRILYVGERKLLFRIFEAIERFVLRRADLVLPMGKFTYELAISKGVNPKKIIILPFPVGWAKLAEISDLPETPTVLFCGRLEKEKGVHILLQAMKVVNKQLSNARLLIAGDGSYRPKLERMATALGLRERVSFLGWLQPEQLREVYRNSWLLVLPSIIEEGLGMVLVEAGLMGRAVVASDIGGIKDIVKQGGNGFLVPPGDPKPLAEAIVTLLRNRELVWQLGLAGRKVAEKYLAGREEAVERTRRAIHELLQNAHKAAG